MPIQGVLPKDCPRNRIPGPNSLQDPATADSSFTSVAALHTASVRGMARHASAPVAAGSPRKSGSPSNPRPNAIFFSRPQRLICFSRLIAACTSW